MDREATSELRFGSILISGFKEFEPEPMGYKTGKRLLSAHGLASAELSACWGARMGV